MGQSFFTFIFFTPSHINQSLIQMLSLCLIIKVKFYKTKVDYNIPLRALVGSLEMTNLKPNAFSHMYLIVLSIKKSSARLRCSLSL